MTRAFRVLSLDGGGSKGVYTIGVLAEVEAILGQPLAKSFDAVYGTSTGSIIAAGLSLGMKSAEIEQLYMRHIPTIMRRFTRRGRSAALAAALKEVFGDRTFADCECRLGVVATEYNDKRPVIFKSQIGMAHGTLATFKPGFGCTLREAVEATMLRISVLQDKASYPSEPCGTLPR